MPAPSDETAVPLNTHYGTNDELTGPAHRWPGVVAWAVMCLIIGAVAAPYGLSTGLTDFLHPTTQFRATEPSLLTASAHHCLGFPMRGLAPSMRVHGSQDNGATGAQPSWLLAAAGLVALVAGARSSHSHPSALRLHAAAAPTANPNISLVIFLSAMSAHALTAMITFPLDTIKTRQQSPPSPPASPEDGTPPPPQPSAWRGLFKGVLPTLLVGIPCSGLYFMLFDFLRRSWNPQERFLLDVACACTAQLFAGTLMIPADAVKIHLQAGTHHTVQEASSAVVDSTHGDGGFCNPTLRNTLILTYLRDFTFACVQMLLYTTLHAHPGAIGMLAGSISAATASLASNPFDAVRTRLLMPSDEKKDGGAASGYFAGLAPRLALSALAGTLFFGLFEMAKPRVAHMLSGAH
jgi:hypothetical protein